VGNPTVQYSTDSKHEQDTSCRNIEMASHCFRASHPITTYNYGYRKIRQRYRTTTNLQYFRFSRAFVIYLLLLLSIGSLLAVIKIQPIQVCPSLTAYAFSRIEIILTCFISVINDFTFYGFYTNRYSMTVCFHNLNTRMMSILDDLILMTTKRHSIKQYHRRLVPIKRLATQ
jgi:hypothetical protein